MADELPNAEVIGTDITPMQPSWVPPNVKFELDDCNAEWTWPDNTFDFVHMRQMFGAVEDWDAILRQAYRTCKPGGYVETFCSDSTFRSDDGTVKEDSATAQWGKVWNAAGQKMGRPFDVVARDLDKKAMEAAGFVDIEFKEYYIPCNSWHKDKRLSELGTWWKISMESDLEGKSVFRDWTSFGFMLICCYTGILIYPFNAVMGWTPEETGSYAKQLRKELANRKIHAYNRARSVWARKPANSK